ncbi:MAG: hypothetical protein GY863_03125 [bacterium]|nr:hypothetical protein [bacterium]
MIEVNMTWRFLPKINHNDYVSWAKEANGIMIRASGLVEFRANRNLLGSPQVRITTVWEKLADWAEFNEGKDWQTQKSILLDRFAAEIKMDIWGPSEIVPEPIRPYS